MQLSADEKGYICRRFSQIAFQQIYMFPTMVNRKMPSLILLIAFVAFGAAAQDVLSLEDCRRMALSNNKTMRIMAEKVRQAEY